MESSLAQTNPELFAKLQAKVGPLPEASSLQPPPSLDKLLAESIGASPLTVAVEGAAPVADATAIALPYSHEAMVDLIVRNPGWTHKKYAAHWGKGTAWFSSVLASDSFQLELDKRRHEILDPSITATMEERFRALTVRGLEVLQDKLDSKEVSDNIVLRATEIGVKALGMGQAVAPPTAPTGNVETLAERLISAFETQRRNARQPVTVENAEVVVESGESK